MEVLLFCGVFFGGKDKAIDALYPGLTVQLQEMPPL